MRVPGVVLHTRPATSTNVAHPPSAEPLASVFLSMLGALHGIEVICVDGQLARLRQWLLLDHLLLHIFWLLDDNLLNHILFGLYLLNI